jgi:hypothetical protein
MPKHCSGIGINLFVQSKERNLFINVYFGAGSSLGCYKICIGRSSAPKTSERVRGGQYTGVGAVVLKGG